MSLFIIGLKRGHENAISAYGYFFCNKYACIPVAKASFLKSSNPQKCRNPTPRIPAEYHRSFPCVETIREYSFCVPQGAMFRICRCYTFLEYRHKICTALVQMCVFVRVHRINLNTDNLKNISSLFYKHCRYIRRLTFFGFHLQK